MMSDATTLRTPSASTTASVRTEHLDRLRVHLEAPDRGGTAALCGPRGVGKRALASEIVSVARAWPGAVVFEGWTPSAAGRSFHPFADIVRQAVAWAEQLNLAEALVDPVFDDLQAVLAPDATATATVPSLDQKYRFFEAVGRLLIGVTETTRMLAIVHDLERADGDTLELARYLAEHLFGDPALSSGHARPGLLLLLVREDGSTSERVRDFICDLDERDGAEIVRLSGLDLGGLRAYLERSRLLEKILAVSDGMPHEIDALFDALPNNVEQLFERRMAAMTPVDRGVLRALALSSRPASARTLAAVTGLAVKDVTTALAAQRAAHVLERRITDGEQQYCFAPRGNQETIVASTTAAELGRLHLGWARAIAASPADGNDALVAHHHFRSIEPAPGVPPALRAAEAYAVAGAFDAAAALLEEALPHTAAAARVGVLQRLSELGSLRAQPREAMRWVQQWKDELRDRDRGPALIREAELDNALGAYDRALLVVAEARLELGTVNSVERVALDGVEAEALYQRSSFDEAQRIATSGLAILEQLDADDASVPRIALLHLLGKIAARREHFAEAKAHFATALAQARRAGLAREEARGLVNIGFAEMRQGDLSAAEDSLRAGAEVARRAHDLSHRAHAESNLGVVAHLRERWGEAIAHYRTARALFHSLGNRTQLARVLMNLANLLSYVGDAGRARAHVSEAMQLTVPHGAETVVGLLRVIEGCVMAREGRVEEGHALLSDVLVQLEAHGAERADETRLQIAEITLDADDPCAAARALGQLSEACASPRIALRTRLLRARVRAATDPATGLPLLAELRDTDLAEAPRSWRAAVELSTGLAHVALGDDDQARDHLAEARRIYDELGAGLPELLRDTFASTGARDRVTKALARMGTLEPATEQRSPSVPAAGRTAAWDAKYRAIVGRSARLLRMFNVLDRVAPTDSTVLITGESGTGKELVAEALHLCSPRARGPFVRLNCAALVESLLLSELFGHERGAFTGAHQRKVGRFEMAAGGTIFLDEIGDISPQTQVALLRVLQAREFERVGGGRPIRLEARVLCATHRDLARMVREGMFREDLYYRLKGLSVEVPALRERPEDVALLASEFIDRHGIESGTPGRVLSEGVVSMLRRHSWPGNVRELENVMRSVALFAEGSVIEPRHFEEYGALFGTVGGLVAEATPPMAPPAPVAVREEAWVAPPEVSAAPIFNEGRTLSDLKKSLQEEAIGRALSMSRGNISKAADILGMKRPRLSQIVNGSPSLRAIRERGGR